MPAHSGRVIALQGALNVREVAGFRTGNGRRIESGMLYRSSALSYLTGRDRAELARLNIHTVIDFRGPDEQAKAPDRLPIGAVSISAPINQDDLNFSKIDAMLDRDGFSARMHDRELVDGYGPFYRMYTLVNSYDDPDFLPKLAAYKAIFDRILDPGRTGAILMHCTGGRDRTGIATAIVLRTLGVPETTIEANYLASNVLLQPDRDDPGSTTFERFTFSNVFLQPLGNRAFQKAATRLDETPRHIYDAVKLRAEYLRKLWATIDAAYGSFDRFLAAEYHLTSSRIARFTEVMTA
ncbi:MAG TPA: tyrosine-protein phosphatase [Mycobacteriales bacterium]|nr:tyrosine-protein phosphatase [Mycobacteriales bacterium]